MLSLRGCHCAAVDARLCRRPPEPQSPSPPLMRRLGSATVFVVTGSASEPWPRPGCACLACVAATDTATLPDGVPGDSPWSNPTGLTAGGLALDQLAPAPGATLEQDGVRLLGVPAGLVAGHAGRAVLWARRPIDDDDLDGLADAGLDGAVLDLCDREPTALAHDVARLRRVGALAPGADLIAVGLTHHQAPSRLVERLAPWGVRLVAAGTEVGVGNTPPPRLPRRTLVLGPASSGKSAVAEDLLAVEPEVSYLATSPAPDGSDPEWAERIRRHRARRPAWWTTIEPDDPAAIARGLATPGPPVLLDSLGGWVGAVLTRCGAWEDRPGWSQRWQQEVEGMVQAWRACRRPVVAVGEETGWGVVPGTASGRVFRDALGTLTRRLAEQSERTLLVVAGRTLDLDQPPAPNRSRAAFS